MPRFTLVPIAAALAFVLGACGTGSSDPQAQPPTDLPSSSAPAKTGSDQTGDDLADLLDQDAATPSGSPVTTTAIPPDTASASDPSGSPAPRDNSASAGAAPPNTTSDSEGIAVEADCVRLPDLPATCFSLLLGDGEIILVEPLSEDERAEFQFACAYQENYEACEVLEFLGPSSGVDIYYSTAPTEVLVDACENLTGVEQKLACAEIASR